MAFAVPMKNNLPQPHVITPVAEALQKQIFLLEFSDALRPLANPAEIAKIACKMLVEALCASKAEYTLNQGEPGEEIGEVWGEYVKTGSSMPKRFLLAPFGENNIALLRSGSTYVLTNAHTDAGLTPKQRAAFIAVESPSVISVPLVKDGRFVATFTIHDNKPRGWTSWEISLVEEVAERTWAAVEKGIVEDNLRKSKDKYRTLFESIDEGFCIIEMLYDENGVAVDYLFIEVNHVFEKQTGLRNVVGQTVNQLTGGIERYWLDDYDQVARTGKPLRKENYHKATNRWYLAYAARVGDEDSRQIAVVFDDITGRKQQEQYHAYLLKLSDALRDVADPNKIQAIATRLLGEELGANQAHYSETMGDFVVINQGWGNLLQPMIGKFKYMDFGKMLVDGYRTGKLQVSHNINTDPNITDDERAVIANAGFNAYMAMPLVKNGVWVSTLAVHNIKPRRWKQHEMNLLKETAERTWAAVERAKAIDSLHVSERWLKGQQMAFSAAMNGEPLSASLQPLVDTIIQHTHNKARAAFYMEPQKGAGLHLITGMTSAYADDMSGFKIGRDMPACGLAMHTGKPVITADVEEDLLWKPFIQIPRKHEFRACWSFPIRTTDGPVMGTLAIYFAEPRTPTPSELEMAEVFAHAASIIISRDTELKERSQAEAALRKNEADYRKRLEAEVRERTIELNLNQELLQATLNSNPEMIQVFKALRNEQGEIIDFVWILNNHAAEQAYGDVIGKRLLQNNPGVETEGIFENFVKVTETGIPQQYEKHYVHEQFDGWFYQSVVKLDDGVATNTANITGLKKAEEKLRKLEAEQQQEVFRVSLNTVEEERRRIAESIHNGLGQVLYGIKISLAGLIKDMPWADFEETKNYTNHLLTDVIQESRRISHELMPATLEEFGLKTAIADMCRQLEDGIHFRYKLTGLEHRLEKYLELAIYRTMQELLMNVVKHSGATHAYTELKISPTQILIKVKDNGRGINDTPKHKPGIGLASIRSKIKLLNGRVEITSPPNEGTQVEVTIPLPDKD